MPNHFPPIPEGDPPESRGKDEEWHVGLMITQRRAIAVASDLFPSEVATGEDCQEELGREGDPCRICRDRNQQWTRRVAAVRRSMIRAFA